MNIKRIGLIGGNGVPVGGSGGTGSSTIVVDNLESLSKSAALSANMGRELNETKAPKVGYAPDLKVSYAEELVGRGEATPEEIGAIRSTSGEQTSIKDGNATIEKIKGKTVVWNQIIRFTAATAQYEKELYSITLLGGTIAVTKSEGGLVNVDSIHANFTHNFVALRKYLLIYNLRRSDEQNTVHSFDGAGIYDGTKYHNLIKTSRKDYKFFSPTESFTSKLIQIVQPVTKGVALSYTLKPVVYDLTQMFGAGNEPTTIEEFEARKPLGVTNEYNEGTIVSFQGGDIKSVGFNAFDGSKAKVVGGQAYYLGGTYTSIGFTKEVDGELTNITVPSDKIYTPSENGYIYAQGTNICIHLVHSGYRNGDYEPYVEDIHPLPDIKSIKDNNGDVLFPYGLLSAGSVYDEITTTKAIKRVGVVDMGTQSWTKIKDISRFTAQIKDMIISPGTLKANVLTPLYITTTLNVNKEGLDKSIAYASGYISIVDNAYTDANSFKQAMQGVLLYYELAEPIEVDLPEPLNMTYEAWDFGTEELISTDVTTPLNADIVYLFNAVDRIRENSKHVEESEKKLTKLQFHVDDRSSDNIELLSNGNLKLTLKGITKEFMPATSSGDPLHYAYATAGAEYNATTDFIVKDAPWKDMVDTIEDKAKWGFDVVDASEVKQMTIGNTTYNYVQTTRQSPEGTTEPRYFLVGQASDGTWVEDETKVLHLPGHWYLNGLGDITGKEMNNIYNAPRVNVGIDSLFSTNSIRTAIPGTQSGGEGTPFSLYYICANSYIVALNISVNPNTSYIHTSKLNGHTNTSFKYFINIMKHNGNQTTVNNSPSLKTLLLSNLKSTFSVVTSKYISKISILHIINNSNPTTAITITLHANRYAQLAQDADVVAALEAKNAALEGTGGSISLVSA